MQQKKIPVTLLVTMIIFFFSACEKFTLADDELLDGPVEGLSSDEHAKFMRGDQAFNDDIFTITNGLGPLFVATSCGSCHAGDGKGHPFTSLTRFGQMDTSGNQYLSMGGPQLQNRAIPGHQPETVPAGASFSVFLPPAVTGLGFLDAVTDADIMSMADPNDDNGDGISGVPNWVHAPAYIPHRPGTIVQNNRTIGRFGFKAAAYNLLHQTVNAYNQDMGINSVYDPYDTYSGLETDPEIATNTLHDVVFYLTTLKAPIQRNQQDPEIIDGKQKFISIGCENCHRSELHTGSSPVLAIAFKTFAPYTDLLLHDMGPGLNDGYTEGIAATGEWRTTPLWGLGLARNSQGGNYYLLHDGRAHSIEEAIVLHGGEAQASRNAFMALNETDKQHLIKFLESL